MSATAQITAPPTQLDFTVQYDLSDPAAAHSSYSQNIREYTRRLMEQATRSSSTATDNSSSSSSLSDHSSTGSNHAAAAAAAVAKVEAGAQ